MRPTREATLRYGSSAWIRPPLTNGAITANALSVSSSRAEYSTATHLTEIGGTAADKLLYRRSVVGGPRTPRQVLRPIPVCGMRKMFAGMAGRGAGNAYDNAVSSGSISITAGHQRLTLRS